MARLTYVKPDTNLAEVELLYAEFRRLGRPVAHLYQALANQPPALRAFLGMSRYVRDESSLSPALRELAILATARELRQPYETAHHRRVARGIGVSDEELAAIDEGAWDRFPSGTQHVLEYASQVGRTRTVSDVTFAQLVRDLPLATVTDLVVTVAWYHFCAAILGPLEIEVEEELPPGR